MKWPALVTCILLVGCGTYKPAPAYKAAYVPEELPADAVMAQSAATVSPDSSNPNADALARFSEDSAEVASIRMSANAADFYGSKLFDGFNVVVQPLDANDRPIRRAGLLDVTLYNFDGDTVEAVGQPMMTWHVSASRMLTLWRDSTLQSGGYHMKLVWHERPLMKYLRMEARFTTLEGETFITRMTPSSVDQPRYRWLEK